jgi:hypothetical protein
MLGNSDKEFSIFCFFVLVLVDLPVKPQIIKYKVTACRAAICECSGNTQALTLLQVVNSSSLILYRCGLYQYLQRGPKKFTHSLIVNIFGTQGHVVTILARYCSVMFAHL